jgi:uncharacterized damage-inducible protein DinB
MPRVNDALLVPFRHHTWATRELLAACRDLTGEQLEASVKGTYGGIRATFHHVLESDAYYLGLLSGSPPAWYREEEDEPPPSMDELERRAADLVERWERFLAGPPIDPGRWIGRENWEVEAGVLLAQALDHGSEHRSQVATILTQVARQPPSLDGWAYGEVSGRSRDL